MKKIAFLAALSMFAAAPAFADEVIVHRDGGDTATSKTVETHTSNDGCTSKTVHKENDAGDSKTVHKTDC